jgi:hypothetical protein
MNKIVVVRIVWREAAFQYPQERCVPMKVITALLITLGIVGLVLSAIFPVIIGIRGIIGSLAALLIGFGFLFKMCFPYWK